MIGTIFSAIAGGLKVVAIALGWMKQDSDQTIGKQLQAGADAEATIKEDANAQKIDAAVADQSRAALIDELRDPSAS